MGAREPARGEPGAEAPAAGASRSGQDPEFTDKDSLVRRLERAWASLAAPLAELLFPRRCPGCRELVEGPGPFCGPCADSLLEMPAACCPLCGQPGAARRCPHCLEAPPAFERATSAFLHGGALAEAIHRFKYEDCPQYARLLARLARAALEPEVRWSELLAPVPLHPSRLRKRGYDQALLLARQMARWAGRPVLPRAVRRVRPTAPQVGRDRTARERNVQGAFAAASAAVRGRRVLLVDDVLTTGATAHAAALALRQAGAAAVRVASIARAE